MENPFEELNKKIDFLINEVADLKGILNKKEDINLKFYTRKEAANILRVSVQTVDNYIKSGALPIFQKDKVSGKKLIKHIDLFDEKGASKDMKYKRVDEFDSNKIVITPTGDYPKDEKGEVIIEMLKERVKISDVMQSDDLNLSVELISVLSSFLFSGEYVDEINKDDFFAFKEMKIKDWEILQELIKNSN